MELVEGAVIGRYRIVKRLGSGGMGDVYLGIHERLGRQAALKVLQPQYSADTNIVERFFKEAKAATSINDPGIVQVFDCDYHDSRPYIAMEALEGESLDHRLAEKGRLLAREALRLCRQIARSLAAAHNKGIVHRDLKPANVFLVLDGEVSSGERAKILDFGIAKLVDDPDKTKTHTGVVMGTPPYMSPEQCRGVKIDHRSDIYSLGCMLFHLLTGQPPFEGEAAGDFYAAHMNRVAPAPSSIVAALPSSIDALVLRCLAKSPEARYQSMDEFADATTRLLLHLPTLDPGRSPRDSETGPPRSAPPTEFAGNSTDPLPTAPLSTEPSVERTSGGDDSASNDVSNTLTQLLPKVPRARPLRGLAVAAAVCGVFAVAVWLRRSPDRVVHLEADAIAPGRAVPPTYDLVLAGSNTIGGIDAASGKGLARDLLIEFFRQRGASAPPVEELVPVDGDDESDRKMTFGLPDDRTVRVLVRPHGSETAVPALTGSSPEPYADLGMSSYPQPRLQTGGFSEAVIAVDAVAVIVHRDNRLPDLTLEQLGDIFGPDREDGGLRKTEWSALPNHTIDGPIHTYGRDNKSGTSECFRERTGINRALSSLGRAVNSPLSYSGIPSGEPGHEGYEDTQKVIDRVSSDRQAIGYLGRAANLPRTVRAVRIRPAAGYSAFSPTKTSIATMEYSMARELYFYYRTGGERPLVAEFVDFCLSDAGQRVVDDVGFVGFRADELADHDPALGDHAPQALQTRVARHDRIRISFRFKPGKDELDTLSEQNLRLLEKLLGRPGNRGRSLLVVGSVDSIGDPKDNLNLSRQRAENFKRRLIGDGVTSAIDTEGYGNDYLLYQDRGDRDSPEAQRNRRVEVYIAR